MSLKVHCRDVGFDCDGIVQAETEDELLQQVAKHAQSVHGLEMVTDEIIAKVKSVIQEEWLWGYKSQHIVDKVVQKAE